MFMNSTWKDQELAQLVTFISTLHMLDQQVSQLLTTHQSSQVTLYLLSDYEVLSFKLVHGKLLFIQEILILSNQ